jgi:hypothetical protein
MKNQKMLSLFNHVAWILLISLVASILWSNRSCSRATLQSDYDKPENLKKTLLQAGPFLFWREDSLDVHNVEAGFMQYYEAKKHQYAYQEAMNTTFECFTKNGEEHFSFKLHPIEISPSNYDMPEKMLVLGSDFSNFEGFEKSLIANGVIDKAYNWTFGKGHLVLTGGPMYSMEREFLYWLIYKLEHEAPLTGGKVHVIMGQDPFQKIENINRESKPDFFKLQNWQNDTLFQKNSELGRWLYSKNVVENIGGYLILQSGLNEDIIDGLPLDTINNIFREVYKISKKDDYGLFCVDANLQKRILKPLAQRADYRFSEIVFGNIAYSKGNTDKLKNTVIQNSNKRVDRLLNMYRAKHLIGRFPIWEGSIETENNHKYIGAVPDNSKRNNTSINTNDIRYEGLWIENNQAYIVDDEGKRRLLLKD